MVDFDGVVLTDYECELAVGCVFKALKSELREEARTVGVCKYILTKAEDKLNAKLIEL